MASSAMRLMGDASSSCRARAHSVRPSSMSASQVSQGSHAHERELSSALLHDLGVRYLLHCA